MVLLETFETYDLQPTACLAFALLLGHLLLRHLHGEHDVLEARSATGSSIGL